MEINMEVALQPRMIQFSLTRIPALAHARRAQSPDHSLRVRGRLIHFSRHSINPTLTTRARRVAETVTPQVFTLLNQ